ncbi:AarF/ABC1/UbiB kinase family protein [Candidatus Woesearchaeota archaeon]|nr:AarF/ABC1/UbiB kinase family protein [Candidatus Woesearchaeota archaeon]
MSVNSVIRNFRDLKRLEEILVVFLEEGFGYFIDAIKLSKHLPFHRKIQLKVYKRSNNTAVRLRRAFERLGPTFVKFGQILSLRPDLIPYDYVLEFEKMQDKVPSFSFSQVDEIIKRELGKPIRDIFNSFDKKPVASASIAQVHKAVLKNGKVVAVKVKRPGVDEIMALDIKLMKVVAKLLEENFDELKMFHIPRVVDEFEKWTLKELRLRVEAANAERFRKNCRSYPDVVVPKIYREYVTDSIIVMDFIAGVPLSDVNFVKKRYKNVKKYITNGFGVILKQIFEDGFFHADPHPGNILLLKNGKIALLDFGIVGYFDEKLRRNSLDFLLSIINNDPDRAVKVFEQFGMSHDVDMHRFREEVRDLFQPIAFTNIRDVEISLIIENAIHLASKYSIHVPVDYVLFGKTLITLEGLALKYSPDYKLVSLARPRIKQIIRKQYSLKSIKRKVKSDIEAYANLFSSVPDKTTKLLDILSRGKIGVDIEDADVKNLTLEMEKSSGNLAIGMICAAMVVGSALVLQVPDQPVAYGLPLIPTIGFCIAAIFGIWVLIRTIFVKR